MTPLEKLADVLAQDIIEGEKIIDGYARRAGEIGEQVHDILKPEPDAVNLLFAAMFVHGLAVQVKDAPSEESKPFAIALEMAANALKMMASNACSHYAVEGVMGRHGEGG